MKRAAKKKLLKSKGRVQAATRAAPSKITLERSDMVLWSLSPRGIVLHDLIRNAYLELDEVGYRTWGFLDGARTLEETIDLSARSIAGGRDAAVTRKVRRAVRALQSQGFLVERTDGPPT
jgi:hypothetical protein